MAGEEQNLNINLDVTENTASGATAQDENFDQLTGGSQRSNRKGIGLGDDVFRPKFFEAMPELLNLLSIGADTFTTIRKVFLPLRKIYQLMANNAKKEEDILKKEESTAVDDDEVSDPGELRDTQPEDFEELIKQGFQFRKGGTMLPFLPDAEGVLRPQGRAKKGGTFIDPTGKAVTPFEPIKKLQNTRETVDESRKAAGFFKKGFQRVFKAPGKLFSALSGKLISSFVPLAVLKTTLATTIAVVKGVNFALRAIGRDFESFSSEVQLAKAGTAIKELEANIRGAELTGDELATSERIGAETLKLLKSIGATLIDTLMPAINGVLAVLNSVLRIIDVALKIIGPPLKIIAEILAFIGFLLDTAIAENLKLLTTIADISQKGSSDFFKWMYNLFREDPNKKAMRKAFDLMGVSMDEFQARSETIAKSRMPSP